MGLGSLAPKIPEFLTKEQQKELLRQEVAKIFVKKCDELRYSLIERLPNTFLGLVIEGKAEIRTTFLPADIPTTWTTWFIVPVGRTFYLTEIQLNNYSAASRHMGVGHAAVSRVNVRVLAGDSKFVHFITPIVFSSGERVEYIADAGGTLGYLGGVLV